MDLSLIIMWFGFILAAYSVVGNDSIQTLGTFLSSNEERPWYVLWIFAGGILAGTMIYGWNTTESQRIRLYEKSFVAGGESFEGYAIKAAKEKELYFFYREVKTKLDKVLIYPSTSEGLSEVEMQQFREKDFVELSTYAPNDGGVLEKTGTVEARSVGLFRIEIRDEGEARIMEVEGGTVRDVSYSRLEKYDLPFNMPWYYLLPPIVLLFLTRTGIPVSTSFLILTFFNEKNLNDMVIKSVSGYGVAFLAGIIIYVIITRVVEKRFIENPITAREQRIWVPLQWISTGFLWSQWLIQDFANIYAYLPRDLSGVSLAISLIILLSLLAYIFYQKGGAIQEIVKAKTNTVDIRSATLIDATYGIVLFYFKELNNVPMSTTWVFIGLLAGREVALRFRLEKKVPRPVLKMVFMDFAKVLFGLIVSIVLVFLIKWISKGALG